MRRRRAACPRWSRAPRGGGCTIYDVGPPDADSEFASDTSESVPRARSLYLDALQLLGNDDLAPPAECQALVASMDFSFIPTDWRGVTQQLQTALVGAMSRLSPAASAQLQSGVTGTLKDTTMPKWGDRFVKAFAAVKAAVLAAPKPPKLSALIQSDRNVRAQAQLALLSAAEWQHADAALQKDIRRRFRAAVSDLTGVDESLLAGDSTLHVDWLSKPSRTRRAALDPAQRSPVLVQPERVISRAFKQRWRWDPLAPTRQGMLGQARAEAPALALASADVQSVQYLPTASVNFCIPPNPVINALRLRGQLDLYKLRSGRNISGVQRQLDFYAAPTDAQSGLPGLSANGGLAISNTGRLTPTEFRYATLVERARRQAQLAAQFESLLLQSLEKADNQRENLLRARKRPEARRAGLRGPTVRKSQ